MITEELKTHERNLIELHKELHDVITAFEDQSRFLNGIFAKLQDEMLACQKLRERLKV